METAYTAKDRRVAASRAFLPAAAICLNFFAAAQAFSQASQSLDELTDLSLEDLLNLQVTSVSRRSESLSEAPAAVYVISREDIIRSGVTSIAEALRLAPGVEVVRRGSSDWAISIRGFNIDLSNKLLVLIDGRSVYSPLYAGVNWDIQDTLLEDVERIEVIAGPGGTVWGANAVNGVINIITRSSEETQGAYVEAGGGNEEQAFGAVRYGGKLRENIAARAYLKYFNREASEVSATDLDGTDDWQMVRGGFRVDWEASQADGFMFQGSAYTGKVNGIFMDDFSLGTLPGDSFEDDAELTGAYLLGRWSREFASGANLRFQTYFDHSKRNIPNNFNETRDTLDFDFQHQFTLAGSHDIVWGAGFRVTGDDVDNSLYTTFVPDSRTDRTYSLFLQDKIDLGEGLFLTLGSKFEHNDYTGFEFQPSARVSWLATERQTLWAAVSRAVRIPSRLDSDLRAVVPVDAGFPAYVTINGSSDFESEELLAYEAGYRIQPRDDLTFDITVFYHDYDHLQSAEPGELEVVSTPVFYAVLPNTIDNLIDGESYGATAMAIWKPLQYWRLQLQYTYFDLHQHNKPGGQDIDPEHEGNSPENQLAVYSFMDLPGNLSLYTGVRYVDELPFQEIGDYIAVDASLRWQPVESVVLSVTGQNLNQKSHPEFGNGNEIERSIFGKITWRY